MNPRGPVENEPGTLLPGAARQRAARSRMGDRGARAEEKADSG